ncbi:hypothetical protein H0H87_010825, partial [Tephrocybe sp. NHM501043]
VIAQTSLYIPGLDPQPLIADILGIDGQGRTTWAVHQAPLTAVEEGGLPGTATLVEGPNDASFTYVPPGREFTLGQECALSGGLAICSGTVDDQLVTATETADYLVVQAGTTATSNAPTEPTVTPTNSVSPPPSSAPSSSAQTSENSSSAPSPTQTSGSRMMLPPLISGFIISTATFALLVHL